MPIPARKIVSGLDKLDAERKDSRDIIYRVFSDDGTLIAKTKISHGSSEISDNLVSQIAKQLFLRKKQLMWIVDCIWGRQDYLKYYETSPLRRL
jgi:hypothetical protein